MNVWLYSWLIISFSSIPSLSDEQSITKSSAVCVDHNPYKTTPEPSVKTTPLHHTDFNQEPPSQCTTLQHVHTNTPGSQVDGGNSLMVSLGIPAYVVLQEVQESGVSTTHKEGEGALKDDQGIRECRREWVCS